MHAPTLAEAVLEAAGQGLHVAHAASAGGLAPNGLLAPLDCKQTCCANNVTDMPDVACKFFPIRLNYLFQRSYSVETTCSSVTAVTLAEAVPSLSCSNI